MRATMATKDDSGFLPTRSGSNCTDAIVLVVDANDGLMPQTRESISYAKEGDGGLHSWRGTITLSIHSWPHSGPRVSHSGPCSIMYSPHYCRLE